MNSNQQSNIILTSPHSTPSPTTPTMTTAKILNLSENCKLTQYDVHRTKHYYTTTNKDSFIPIDLHYANYPTTGLNTPMTTTITTTNKINTPMITATTTTTTAAAITTTTILTTSAIATTADTIVTSTAVTAAAAAAMMLSSSHTASVPLLMGGEYSAFRSLQREQQNQKQKQEQEIRLNLHAICLEQQVHKLQQQQKDFILKSTNDSSTHTTTFHTHFSHNTSQSTPGAEDSPISISTTSPYDGVL